MPIPALLLHISSGIQGMVSTAVVTSLCWDGVVCVVGELCQITQIPPISQG